MTQTKLRWRRIWVACLLCLSLWIPAAAQNSEAQALELGKPVARELAGEQIHAYLIALAANDFLQVMVEQRGVDVVVTAYAPDGQKLKEVDSPNGSEGPEPLLLLAATAGTYRLEVRPWKKEAAGKYAVTLTAKRSATAENRAQVARQALVEQAQELSNQAQSLSQQRRYKEAAPLYQRALKLREQVLGPGHPFVAAALSNLARLYRDTGDYARALSLTQRALAIYEKALGPQHPAVANLLSGLAELYYVTGDYPRALPLFQRALAIAEKAYGPEHPEVATALSNLAELHRATGDYARAAPLYQRALTIYEQVLGPEHPAVALPLSNLAVLYHSMGDYPRAIPLAQRALAIREKALGPEHPDVAASLNNLAIFYYAMGDYVRAAPLYQRALTIYEKALGPEHPEVATALNNLAELHRATGDYARAAPFYQRALAIAEKALGPEHPDVAASLNNLANLYRDTGDYTRAAPLFQRTLTIYEKALGPEHPSVATALNNLATLYRDTGDYPRAAPLYQRALTIYEKALGPQHPDVALSLNNLALLYQDTGDYAQALPLYQRSLAIWEEVLGPAHPTVATSLTNLALLYQATSDYLQAVSFITRAAEAREKNIAALLDTGSQQQKQLYLNTLSYETSAIVSLHAKDAPNNNDAARLALTTILRRKGRALDAFTGQLEALRRRAHPTDKQLLDDLAAAQSRFANLQLSSDSKLTPEARRVEVARLTTEQERLEDAIGRRSAEFRAVRQSVTLKRVQAAVPNDAALVELFIYQPFDAKKGKYGAARYVAYIVRQKDAVPQFADLGEAAPIDADAAKFRAALQSAKTPEANVKQLARNLDERVMRPMRKLLGPTKRVLLAPDGALNLVPFAALVDENGKYLLQNYDFNYLTSGRDLLRRQIAGESQEPAAIVANPLFDARTASPTPANGRRNIGLLGTGDTATVEARALDFAALYYPPLSGTATEARDIGALLPNARVWTQSAATEAALKAVNRPRLLHIATHGFFLPDQAQPAFKDTRQLGLGERPAPAGPQQENPMLRSGLILAGVNQKQSGPDNDGVLTAQEAAGLNLFGTKLVVLSACETGLGEVQNGAGVYGLRRALVLAGSETQVMSLWQVSDAATQDLMIAYYTRLQSGAGRINAMRQVQLAMLRGTVLAKSSDIQRNLGLVPQTLQARPVGLGTADIIPKAAWRHPYYWAAFIPSGAWTTLDGKEPNMQKNIDRRDRISQD